MVQQVYNLLGRNEYLCNEFNRLTLEQPVAEAQPEYYPIQPLQERLYVLID